MLSELSLMEEDDIAKFAEVYEEAVANWGVAQAMTKLKPTGEPRLKMNEYYLRKGFLADSRQTYLKVTDTETGEMIAGAIWRFVLDPGEESSDGGIPMPKESVEAVKGHGVPERPRIPAVALEMQRQWTEFRERCFPNQSYASMLYLSSNILTPQAQSSSNLQILVMHPEHQHRGAGSMLMKWGCDRADERRLISVLQASQAGLNVYLKHGFEIKMEVDLDLRPYGVDGFEIRRGMVRPPRWQ